MCAKKKSYQRSRFARVKRREINNKKLYDRTADNNIPTDKTFCDHTFERAASKSWETRLNAPRNTRRNVIFLSYIKNPICTHSPLTDAVLYCLMSRDECSYRL